MHKVSSRTFLRQAVLRLQWTCFTGSCIEVLHNSLQPSLGLEPKHHDIPSSLTEARLGMAEDRDCIAQLDSKNHTGSSLSRTCPSSQIYFPPAARESNLRQIPQALGQRENTCWACTNTGPADQGQGAVRAVRAQVQLLLDNYSMSSRFGPSRRFTKFQMASVP